MKKLFLLLFISFCLISCIRIPNPFGDCEDKTLPHPDNKKNKIDINSNKVLYIHNKTADAYKNNKFLHLSLMQEIATGKYMFFVMLHAPEAIEKLKKMNTPQHYHVKMEMSKYDFEDIYPGENAIKGNRFKKVFHVIHNFGAVRRRRYANFFKIFKKTKYNCFLLYLDKGNKKVFFALDDNKSTKTVGYVDEELTLSGYYALYVNEYDSEPRSDGFCYHTQYSQVKDIFVSDTHITLENDKATSNHKVVTHITLGGKRIELATMSIKKMLLDENWVFLRLEDFK